MPQLMPLMWMFFFLYMMLVIIMWCLFFWNKYFMMEMDFFMKECNIVIWKW